MLGLIEKGIWYMKTIQIYLNWWNTKLFGLEYNSGIYATNLASEIWISRLGSKSRMLNLSSYQISIKVKISNFLISI